MDLKLWDLRKELKILKCNYIQRERVKNPEFHKKATSLIPSIFLPICLTQESRSE